MIGGKFTNLNRTANSSIGSKATPAAMKKALETSKAARKDIPSHSNGNISQQRKLKPTIHPGSRAGLNNQKSVHLNANNSGYLNPSVQRARLKDRTRIVDTSPQKPALTRNLSNRVNDMRLSSSTKNSISILNKIR
jgi:hypothetical protein